MQLASDVVCENRDLATGYMTPDWLRKSPRRFYLRVLGAASKSQQSIEGGDSSSNSGPQQPASSAGAGSGTNAASTGVEGSSSLVDLLMQLSDQADAAGDGSSASNTSNANNSTSTNASTTTPNTTANSTTTNRRVTGTATVSARKTDSDSVSEEGVLRRRKLGTKISSVQPGSTYSDAPAQALARRRSVGHGNVVVAGALLHQVGAVGCLACQHCKNDNLPACQSQPNPICNKTCGCCAWVWAETGMLGGSHCTTLQTTPQVTS